MELLPPGIFCSSHPSSLTRALASEKTVLGSFVFNHYLVHNLVSLNTFTLLCNHHHLPPELESCNTGTLPIKQQLLTAPQPLKIIGWAVLVHRYLWKDLLVPIFELHVKRII